MDGSMKANRVSQDEYNRQLCAFDAKDKPKRVSVNYLTARGFSYGQAKNAVHVYFRGSTTSASFRLSGKLRNQLLDDFDAKHKSHKDCVKYLMDYGCTYRQANSASYQYRLEKGLIN